MYLGGWLDKDKQTGQVYAYFDASKNIQNLDEVVSVAVSSRQIAIYDVNNDRSIYIDYENNQRLWYWLDPKNEEGKTWLK